VALAGQPTPAGRTAAALLARRGHLRRNNLGLKCRGQPFRFGKPKPKVSQASVRVALDAGHSVSVKTPGPGSATDFTSHTNFATRPSLPGEPRT
jgi:hypothetical protein